jgi:hypothetical protein
LMIALHERQRYKIRSDERYHTLTEGLIKRMQYTRKIGVLGVITFFTPYAPT